MEHFEQHRNLESRERQKVEAYFSISNLVRRGRFVHPDGREETFDIAIMAGTTKEGKRRFQAVGGGAKLSETAVEELRTEYPSIRFREGEEATDARFYIPIPHAAQVNPSSSEEEQAKETQALTTFVHEVMDRFVDPKAPVFTDTIEREILEELTETKEGYEPVLTEAEAQKIETSYVGATSPIQWSKTTSGRSGSAAVYHRIFHLYDITIPEDLFNKLKNSERIRILSPEDIAAIRSSTQKGNAAAELSDGSVVVENIFPDFHTNASRHL
jgi:hypothetical protein